MKPETGEPRIPAIGMPETLANTFELARVFEKSGAISADQNLRQGHIKPHPVNIAPFQLAEEYLRIHRASLLALIFRRE